VSRALKLMSEGRAGTRSDEFEHLARRLGVGPRHLRRLFAEHLGASPSAVARRLRLEEARRLLEQPRLGIGDIADAAGFRSRRCFNEAFRKAFGAAPREMRKQAAASR
jgi:AraC family transcriptional regulator of adaptative response / DNA-3-methyladenine glycosylase II